MAFQDGPAHAAIVAEVRPERVDAVGLADCEGVRRACQAEAGVPVSRVLLLRKPRSTPLDPVRGCQQALSD